MRIFLSYGHDQNEELVRLIKTDLEARGHHVWFDRNEIKGGHHWRRSITEGIVESHRVLAFLSKHSTRDPGVCLDEIAIAIGAKGGNIKPILVEKDLRAPASISHIQYLDLRDWRAKRDAGLQIWDSWYREKFAELVAIVESDESRRFAGEISELETHLKPISSDSRLSTLLRRPLVGRAWLFDALEKWRAAADRSSRIFWVMGAPGVGKSAFAAHLAHYGRDKVVALQFVEWDKPDHRDPRRIIRTLAFQLATRLPDYRQLLLTLPEIKELDRKQTAAELFDYLLANPLKLTIGGGRERQLVIIDALDEAGGDGRNPLVEMLARHAPSLPDWIGLVVTSRPESDVRAPLQGLNPFVLDTATESNRADLRAYLRHELAPQLQNRPDADRLVEQILEKSEGVFLYAERFCDDVHQKHLTLDRPEQFPQGLGGIFFEYFRRQFPDLEIFRNDVRPALRAILAAREPLPLEILQRLLNLQDEGLRDFTRPLGSMFPVVKDAGADVLKPYHKSLADWLTDEAKAGVYFVSKEQGNRLLAEECWRDFKRSAEEMSDYALRHLVTHLTRAGRKKEVAKFSQALDSNFTLYRRKAILGLFVGAIDIGTSKVTVLVAEIGRVSKRGYVAIIGRGMSESRGVVRGEICDLAACSECVRAAVLSAEKEADVVIERLFSSQSSGHLVGCFNSASVGIHSATNQISAQDVKIVCAEAKKVHLPPSRVVVQEIRGQFAVDGRTYSHNPEHLVGTRLEVGYWLVHGMEREIESLHQAVRATEREMGEIRLAGLASAYIVTNVEERARGVLVVDIGAGKSDYVLYREGVVYRTGGVCVGGIDLTNAIAAELGVESAKAEEIKCRLELNTHHDTVKLLDGIIHAWTIEILGAVRSQLAQAFSPEACGAGLVLTGGAARNVPAAAAKAIFGINCNSGEAPSWVSDELKAPGYSTVLGLISLASRDAAR
jgi:cell division protein FtsA